ncbi:hypothetical protein OY671_010066, partial [Metschnikowia pulcherrima]
VPAFADLSNAYGAACPPGWKASTLKTHDEYRRHYSDDAFPGKFVDEITEADVTRWFRQTTDRAGPGGANRVFAILKAAFYKAERWGYRPDGCNPCCATKANRTRVMERHLSTDESARSGAVSADARRSDDPYRSACASAVSSSALTGCRSSEIMTARWSDVRGSRSSLRDSKTGPR